MSDLILYRVPRTVMRHWKPFQTVLSETGLKDQSSSPKPAPELRPVAGIVPAGCRESPPHYTYTYSGSLRPLRCGKDDREQSLDSKSRPWLHPGRQAPPSPGCLSRRRRSSCVWKLRPGGRGELGPRLWGHCNPCAFAVFSLERRDFLLGGPA